MRLTPQRAVCVGLVLLALAIRPTAAHAAFTAVPYGPQPTITCPVGAIQILPGANIQSAITAAAGGTTFCLRAGTHPITSVLTAKSNDVFVGEYGTILDGSGWVTTDEAAGAWKCIGGQAITGVTVKNLAIRNMPKKGIYAVESCTGWTVENVEVGYAAQWGIVLGSGLTVRNSRLHHNGRGVGGNYSFYLTVQNPGTNLVENNEISYGGEQKAINSSAITWRNNWFHDNFGAGLWNDGEGNGSIIEDNLLEDNWIGLHVELSYGFVIRNNVIRRSRDQAIYMSTSRDSTIYNNTLEDNNRGVVLYLTCLALTQGWSWSPDLANVTVTGNSVRLASSPLAPLTDVLASGVAFSSECTTEQRSTYTTSKNLVFTNNTYDAPNPSGSYWLWDGTRNFTYWQAIPQDEDAGAPTCTFGLAPTSASVVSAGESGKTVAVTASDGACEWTAAANQTWLSISAGSSGAGSGSVTYAAAANTSVARTGTLTIAGTSFTVTQAAAAAPATFDTTAPRVSWVTPVFGASVLKTSTLLVTATDAVGVVSVTFALDGKTISTDTSAPYSKSYNFRKTSAGNHTLTATARDAAGNTATASITVVR